MPSTLPEGERPPADGRLPDAAAAEIGTRPVGLYVHIPFCRVRCGYCDFNTYTPDQLGTDPGSSQAGYVAAAVAELDLAARVLGRDAPPVSTVFFGGGTPTLLPPGDLGRLLAAVEDRFGLLPGAEVTTESNPESVTAADLAELRELGFNRISFGMQSAVPHVLAALDRIHAPDRPVQAVAEARAAGFDRHQSRSDLRGTRGVARRLGDQPRRGHRRRAGAPERVRADRRGRHQAGGSDPAWRAAAARRR